MTKCIKSLMVVMAGVFGFMPLSAQAAPDYQPPECRLLPDHKAAPDVAYEPGVDVNGRAVVPADLNIAAADLGRQTMVIPLSIDMAQRIDTIAGVKLEGTQGFLEISPDGRVTFNGQDLTPQAYAVCGLKMPDGVASTLDAVVAPVAAPVLPVRAPKTPQERPSVPPTEPPSAPDGQPGADALKYRTPPKAAPQGEVISGQEYQE